MTPHISDRWWRWIALVCMYAAGFLGGMWAFPAHSQMPPVMEGTSGTTSVTLSWTAPTENEDGSPLTDLTRYRIYLGVASGEYTAVVPLDDPALLSYVVEGLQPETTYYVAMTAWNSVGMESDLSAEVDITTGPLRIGPDRTVYTLVQSRNRIALVAVGTVPPGTECDGTQGANGLYVVPVEAVDFAGTVRPEVVVARCN